MSEYSEKTDIPENIKALSECISRRQSAYIEELGGWQEQLDMIFHDFDGWKSAIQSIKNKYPKPSE